MKCNKCNQIIPDDSEFCHLCGNRITKEIPAVKPTPKETPKKPKKSKKPMSKRTRKAIMLTLVSVLSLAVIAILVFCFIIPLANYNHAQELLELGKYDLAYTAFSELGDYGDSQDKLVETRYLQAVDYRNKGEYDVANKIFESLGDYRDSKALIHTHDYSVSDSVAPTCTSKGSETSVCAGCGNSKVKILDATAHYYILSKQNKPTCTATGEETYTCSECGTSYTKTVEMVSHNYVLAKQMNASCTSAGEKRYSCSMCGDSYTEKIEQKAHSWKNATCSAPKTCTSCGKTEGSVLGHSNNVVCTRCGVTTFKTLSYSGTGSKVIDYVLPSGTFKVTVTMTAGQGSVDVKVHYGTESYSYKSFYIYDAGNSKIDNIKGPVISGSIVVNASNNYYGNSSWKVSIEAISN